MKYEFRAVARIVLPMFIVFLCAAMIMSLGFILDGRVLHFLESNENNVLSALAGIAVVIFVLGLIFLLVAINIAVSVLIIYRFYVSFFTDEGYLTFTLPLTIDCHLMIKIFSMFLWSLLSLVVTFVGLLIILGGVAIGYTDALKEFWTEFQYIFEMMWISYKTEFGAAPLLLGIISLIVTSVFQSFLLYFSIALGCMIFKKHRLLGAIISIFCVDTIYSVFASFSSSIVTIFGLVSGVAFIVASVISIVLSVIGIIAAYCAMKYILERKLNLD